MRSLVPFVFTLAVANAVAVDWQHIQTARGDKLPDFSTVGYRQGDHKLPSSQPHDASVIIAASKSSSDDQTTVIQQALDNVAASGGGVVELAVGKHYLNSDSPIYIGSKTWIRGADRDLTQVLVQGTARTVFSMGAANVKATLGASSNITTAYVPIGGSIIAVADASVFQVNQTVYVQRPASAAWIRANGMADLVREGDPQTWIKVGTLIRQPRMISAISGNTLTLSVPVTDAIEKKWATGSVQVYTATGTNNAGIENLRIQITPTCSGEPITDPRCQDFTAVTFQPFTVDSWALNLTVSGFVAGFLRVTDSQRITIENIVSIRDAVSDGSAGWGADIAIDGTQVLVKNCASQTDVAGAKSFTIALSGQTPGPNAVLNYESSLLTQVVQPHMRWAHGLLVEGGTSPIEFINRGTAGSGHGWAINAGVAWNSDANWRIEQPPLGVNWAIGMRGAKNAKSNGTEYNTGDEITPKSLYTAQLQARRAGA